VIVVGSANEDIVITANRLPMPGETVSGTSLTVLPGGKSANQAVAAARAGADVYFVGAVGTDDAGARSAKALRDEQVDVQALSRIADRPTGTAVVVVSADGENQIVIFAGANGALGAVHVESALTELALTPADVCLVGFEVGDEAVSAAARCASAGGARLVVNPAPARKLTEDVVSAQPILIPNSSEAEWLTGLSDAEDSARRLHEITGAPVVISAGARGALIVDDAQSGSRWVSSLEVDVADTTGAGDTLAGVLAAGLAGGLDLDHSVRRAVVAAALSVTVRGARPGSPTSQTIDSALL
jgi:ribokinase